MVEINYRKTMITTSYWINWLEPLKYVKEQKTKELLDKIHFKKIHFGKINFGGTHFEKIHLYDGSGKLYEIRAVICSGVGAGDTCVF